MSKAIMIQYMIVIVLVVPLIPIQGLVRCLCIGTCDALSTLELSDTSFIICGRVRVDDKTISLVIPSRTELMFFLIGAILVSTFRLQHTWVFLILTVSSYDKQYGILKYDFIINSIQNQTNVATNSKAMKSLVFYSVIMHPHNERIAKLATHHSSKKRCRTHETLFMYPANSTEHIDFCETPSKRLCQNTGDNNIDCNIANQLQLFQKEISPSSTRSTTNKKNVSFDMTKNISYSSTIPKEDTKSTWLSTEEHSAIRSEISQTLQRYRDCSTRTNFSCFTTLQPCKCCCIRGIEQYVVIEKSKEKTRNRTIHTRMTLFRYRFEQYQNILTQTQHQQDHQQQQQKICLSSSDDVMKTNNLSSLYELAEFANRINDVFGTIQNATTMLLDYSLKLKESTKRDSHAAYEMAKKDEHEVMK